MATDFSTKETIVFVLSWSLLTQYCVVSAGLICYNCDHLPHQRDCDRIVECGESEYCYGEELISDDGLVTFKSGCRSKARCNPTAPSVGKRDIIPCSRCCTTKYCNLETCDVSVTSNKKRCLSCKYALRPEDCNLSIQCNEDEFCYTQAIIHNQEKRYRLGCIHKNQCGATINPAGKRATPNEYCGRCCVGHNCNREVCEPGFTESFSKLVNPPQQTFCRDNSTSYCRAALANDPNMCNRNYYKFYQCPYTCKQCDTLPVVTNPPITQVTNKVTMKTTMITIDPDVCADYPGINCDSNLVCTVADIAKLCKKTCHLCKAPPSTTVSTRAPPTTTVHTHACKSHDPIPECQCRYLDTEANLCQESEFDTRLKKFCCYYCNRKKGYLKCPDSTCDRLERPEQSVVDKMTTGITCIQP